MIKWQGVAAKNHSEHSIWDLRPDVNPEHPEFATMRLCSILEIPKSEARSLTYNFTSSIIRLKPNMLKPRLYVAGGCRKEREFAE